MEVGSYEMGFEVEAWYKLSEGWRKTLNPGLLIHASHASMAMEISAWARLSKVAIYRSLDM